MIIRTKHSIRVPLCALLACVALSASSCGDRMLTTDQLRVRYRESLIPPKMDISDTLIARRTALADAGVESAWLSLNKAPGREYLWEDSRARFAEAQSLTMDYGRLGAMARAYQTPGSRFQGNDSLLHDVIDGLDWMFAHRYNPSTPMYHNWWEWVIGVPMMLNDILVLLYDELGEQRRADYLSAMDFYAPDVAFEGASTGANKIWQCSNMALRGIIAGRPEQVQMAIDGLDSEFTYVESKDGFYRDGSFVQHQWHPYNGGYGHSMLAHLANVIPMVQGSPWEVPQHHQQMLFEWVHNGYEPLLYRGAMMDMVRGREISRKGNGDRMAGHSILVSMFKLSRIAPVEERVHLRSVVKAHMLSDTCRDLLEDMPTGLLEEARRLLHDASEAPEAEGTLCKLYPAMDRAVYRRPGFALGLAMSSNRIENYETINGENLCAWYTGDGMTYLYDGDLCQYGDDFWPTVNPYRMAGTTVDTRPRKAETLPFGEGLLYADGYKSPERWVGGSSLEGRWGMAGMALSAFESSLRARKSWFMAGDEVVCLGAGITSQDNRPIETIVENRKLNAPKRYRIDLEGLPVLHENGSLGPVHPAWVHFEGSDEGTSMGYWFPHRSAVHLLRETRTGSWYAISQPYGDKMPIEKDYFTLWIDHGRSPREAAYAYVLLPGANLEQTMLYADNPTVEILANTPRVQAAVHRTEGVTGINFWEPGELAASSGLPAGGATPALWVGVDAPCSVIVYESDEELWIGMSDPTQVYGRTITLEVNRTAASSLAADPGVELLAQSPVTKVRFDLVGTLGQTRTIRLKK